MIFFSHSSQIYRGGGGGGWWIVKLNYGFFKVWDTTEEVTEIQEREKGILDKN